MPTAVIKAHFDGEHVLLDEPFKLQPNAPLLVTVFAPDTERAEWSALCMRNLARAYGPDEPDYSEAAVLAALDHSTRRGSHAGIGCQDGPLRDLHDSR